MVPSFAQDKLINHEASGPVWVSLASDPLGAIDTSPTASVPGPLGKLCRPQTQSLFETLQHRTMARGENQGVTPACLSYVPLYTLASSGATFPVSNFVNNDGQGHHWTPTSSLARKVVYQQPSRVICDPNHNQVSLLHFDGYFSGQLVSISIQPGTSS